MRQITAASILVTQVLDMAGDTGTALMAVNESMRSSGAAGLPKRT